MKRVTLVGKYLGGHPQHPKPAKLQISVTVDDGGVRVAQLREMFAVPWSQIAGLEVEGSGQASRVTATRLVTLGVFALAAKKKHKSAYLTVSLVGGGDVVFEIDKLTGPELRGRLAPAFALVPTASVAPATAVSIGDPMERLSLASQLHDAGVLSDEEFAAQKARILADG